MFCNVSKVVLCGMHNTLATFSEDVLQFSWHFGRVHRHFAWQAQHFRRVVVSCCVFFAYRIGRAALIGDKVQMPWQAWLFDAFCDMC